MKHALAVFVVLIPALLSAQTPTELPAVPQTPQQSIGLAGDELVKAGKNRNTSMWFLVFGAAFVAANESQRDGNNYEESISWSIAGIGAVGFVTFQLVASDHEKKAGRLLHRE